MPTSNDMHKELILEKDFLEVLQPFVHPSKSGDERQVKVDLQRMYGLTIKDELTEWSYIKSFEGSAIKTLAAIDPDPDEVFFHRIKRLDNKLQDFIRLNFHQGGMFYAARQFLTFHLNSLGFRPNNQNGHKHHIIFDFGNAEKLVITEKFNVTGLDFIFDDIMLYKVIIEEENFLPIDLEQTDKDKIHSFQEKIMELLGDKTSSNYLQENLRLEKPSKNENKKTQLVSNFDDRESLIEFTLKHSVELDSTSSTGIKIKELSKEDVSFKVHTGLYNLSFGDSKPEFFKLLSPNQQQCVSPGFFAKPKFKSKLNELILNSYRDFILILFNILKLICSPIILSEKASFFAQTEPSESRNSFAYRMRA